jgi:DNA-binding transcriptional regulator YbjK
MPSRRQQALDAAIDLVGNEGLRSLTHARVDERAGLPKGSTSNYFRTRAALMSGVADGILDRELAAVGQAFTPESPEILVDAMVALFEHTTQENRTLTTARLVLFMEASHDPQLRESLSRGRQVMASTVMTALAGLGAAQPQAAAQALMACFEGLILHRIARHDDTDPRPPLELVVRAAFEG